MVVVGQRERLQDRARRQDDAPANDRRMRTFSTARRSRRWCSVRCMFGAVRGQRPEFSGGMESASTGTSVDGCVVLSQNSATKQRKSAMVTLWYHV